jgi:hypothetical protein
MIKELKLAIYETVSTLWKLFVKLKDNSDSKSTTISELETLVANMKAERDEDRGRTAKSKGAPSIIYCRERPGTSAKGLAPTGDGKAKLYSEALGGSSNTTT